ncbi:hypothetical protein LX32DRAFT_119554 [Colletotrichum zoysiae]|uniref:Uncharacterized protein n=1 Tax=Colletotrichum zoysiae TaxID=1216348 RepID=A0AAD9LX57_9PEZI|nr:hypothetical protein LX32DRAFT_119554 [Colletotrichum zoysiae]
MAGEEIRRERERERESVCVCVKGTNSNSYHTPDGDGDARSHVVPGPPPASLALWSPFLPSCSFFCMTVVENVTAVSLRPRQRGGCLEVCRGRRGERHGLSKTPVALPRALATPPLYERPLLGSVICLCLRYSGAVCCSSRHLGIWLFRPLRAVPDRS